MPTKKLAALTTFEAETRNFILSRFEALQRPPPNGSELKYSHFRHLDPATIDEVGSRLNRFFSDNECAIFGFFIPAEGFMNYKLRSDYIDKAEQLRTLPAEEHRRQIEQIRQEMLEEAKDAEHNLGLLKESYRTFFNFILEYHGRFLKKSYRVVYDSRNPEEDAELHADAAGLAALFDRIHPGLFSHYKGYTTSSSSESPGLRLVDWIAGEVRTFFYRNPSVVGGDSSLDVLSPYWNPEMVLIDGRAPFYRRKLSPEAIACFEKTGQGFMLPQIKEHFASGLLTYYAQKGEARHIAIPTLTAFDMAD